MTRLKKWWQWAQTSPVRRWKVIALIAILLLGAVLRIYQFPSYPAGLNQDEISAAYESYSLATTGKDRWGNPWPAYFLGWGSGQNVLQSYLSIPVVATVGLSPLSIRLVPLLLGILILPLLFWVVRRYYGTLTALIATLILAVCPWHVLLSRWGLESNILPFFLLLGVATLQFALDHSRKRPWILLFALLSFAMGFYAYGTSAIVIPLLATGLLALNWKKVVSQWRWWLGAIGIAGLVALPFLIFVLKNYVVHHSLGIEHILPVSIPVLTESRIDQIHGTSTDPSILSPGDPIYNVLFLGHGLNDGTVYNVVGSYLPLSLGILLLALVGIGISFRDAIRSRLRHISPFLIWIIAASGLFFVAALNVNQANAIFLPLVVLAAVATTRIAGLIKPVIYRAFFLSIVAGYIIISGIGVYSVYLSPKNATALSTNYHPELAAAFSELEHLRVNTNSTTYITDTIALNYVQTLYYLGVQPSYFQSFQSTPSHPDFAGFYFDATRIPSRTSYVFLTNIHDEPQCTATTTITWHEGDWIVGICQVQAMTSSSP